MIGDIIKVVILNQAVKILYKVTYTYKRRNATFAWVPTLIHMEHLLHVEPPVTFGAAA